MDEIRVKSGLGKRIVSEFLSHQLVKKLGKPIGFGLYHLDIVEDEAQTYNIQIECDIRISKEDLKDLIWKDRIGSGTS